MNLDFGKEKCCNPEATLFGRRQSEGLNYMPKDLENKRKLSAPVAVKAVPSEECTQNTLAKMVHSTDLFASRLTQLSEVIQLFKKCENIKDQSE